MLARKPPQVLLVDDDLDIRDAVRETLADEGYETIEANDGQEALDYLRSHPLPPVILLDWNMGPMNGRQFMEELAKDPTLSFIPVVLLTADARAEEKSMTGSFAGYLRKPVDLDSLFAYLKLHCG